jgi:hypothetical protein
VKQQELTPQFRTREAAGRVRDHLAVGLSLFLLGLFKKVALLMKSSLALLIRESKWLIL